MKRFSLGRDSARNHSRLAWIHRYNSYRVVRVSASHDTAEKQALYRTGVLALQLNDAGKADRHLRRLAFADSDYKDLPRHLDKIDSIRHKDGFSNDFLPPQQRHPGSEDDSSDWRVSP